MARNDRLAAMTSAGTQFFKAITTGQDPYAAYDRVLAAYKMVGEGMELQGKMKELSYKEKLFPLMEKREAAEVAGIETDTEKKEFELKTGKKSNKRLEEAIRNMLTQPGGLTPEAIKIAQSFVDYNKSKTEQEKKAAEFAGEQKAGVYEQRPEAEAAGFQAGIAKSKVARATDVARYNLGVPKAVAEAELQKPMAEVKNIMSETLKNIDSLQADPATANNPYVTLMAHFDKLGIADDFSKEWDRMIELKTKSLAVDAGANPVQVALGLQIPNAAPGMSPEDAKKAILEEYEKTETRMNEWWLKGTGFTTEQLLEVEPPNINYKFPSGRPVVPPPTGTTEGVKPTATLPQNVINILDALSNSLMQDPKVESMDDVREILNLPETRKKLGIPDKQVDAYIQSLGEQSKTGSVSTATPKATGKWKFTPTFFKPADLTNADRMHRAILSIADDYDIEPELVLAFIKAESDLGRNQKFDASGNGIMQISAKTGLGQFGLDEAKLRDPMWNINAGIAYLGYLKQQGATTPLEILSGYIAGEDNIKDDVYTLIKTGKIKYGKTSEDGARQFLNYKNNINNAHRAYKTNRSAYVAALEILRKSIVGTKSSAKQASNESLESALHK